MVSMTCFRTKRMHRIGHFLFRPEECESRSRKTPYVFWVASQVSKILISLRSIYIYLSIFWREIDCYCFLNVKPNFFVFHRHLQENFPAMSSLVRKSLHQPQQTFFKGYNLLHHHFESVLSISLCWNANEPRTKNHLQNRSSQVQRDFSSVKGFFFSNLYTVINLHRIVTCTR